MRRASERISGQLLVTNSENVRNLWENLVINVKEFGAEEAPFDSTEAFQLAINYAISIGKNDIWIPPGNYVFTNLSNTSGITFYGDKVTLSGSTTLTVVSFHSMSAQIDGFDSDLNSKASQASLNSTNATVALKADKTYVDNQIANVASGSPKGVYATLAALQAAFPTGTTGTYLVTADGKWYYWNGTAWTAGGTYQSTGIAPGSVTATMLNAAYKYVGQLNSSNDLNASIADGTYFISSSSMPANVPVTGKSLVLEQTTIEGAYGVQIVRPFNEDDFLYMRRTVFSSPSSNTPWINIRSISKSNLVRDFNYRGILNSANDLNNLSSLSSGIYLIQNTLLPANYPSTGTGILIQTNYLSSSYAHQEVIDFNDPTLTWTRRVALPSDITAWVCNKPLGGKNLLTIGDSISFGVGGTNNHYQDFITKITGATIINNSFSGAKYALKVDHEPWNSHSFYTLSSTVDLANIDYMWVMFGTNDFNNAIPIGNGTNLDPYTTKGAMYAGLNNFLSRKPTLKIIISTPIFGATIDGTNYANLDITPNSAGLYIADYVSAIKDVCKTFRIPVFDAQYECGINNVNYNTYLSDKLHPNDAGYELIGTKFGRFIMNYV